MSILSRVLAHTFRSPGDRLRRQARCCRPDLEALESRWAPAAVRALTGFDLAQLARGDDNSSEQTALGFSVNFFGKTLEGAWQISHDGSSWEHDFDITFTKVA